jgi:hypothetical protein
MCEQLGAERAAGNIPYEAGLGTLVATLAASVPAAGLGLAMEAAQAIDTLSERKRAVRGVADRLRLMDDIGADVWLRAMKRSGARPRNTALADLGALSSLVGKLGGRELLQEGILAVERVTHWWP